MVDRGSVTVTRTAFVGNIAEAGGVFEMTGIASLTMEGCEVEGNHARRGGGVIKYSGRAHFHIANSTFAGNKAPFGSILQGLGGEKDYQQVFKNCSFVGNMGSSTFHFFMTSILLEDIKYVRNINYSGEPAPIYSR